MSARSAKPGTADSADRCDDYSIAQQKIVVKILVRLLAHLLAEPWRLWQAQQTFSDELAALWQYIEQASDTHDKPEPLIRPQPADKRFRDSAWTDSLAFDAIKQWYLLASRNVMTTVEQIEGLSPHSARQTLFYTRQVLDALAPTNFASLNPQVLTTIAQSKGENLIAGWQALLRDWQGEDGRLQIPMSDPAAFRLGADLAATPGKVIYQTPLMQLLHYQPATPTVHQRPLLIVPPWINKYYIFDLRKDNSFIRWAVEQGFSVFCLSWVNPDERLADCGFDDYMHQGVLAALAAIERAIGAPTVNAIGYCLGGTLLSCTLAYLAATNSAHKISSASLLATLIDFSDVGNLAVFIDEDQLARLDCEMAARGYLDARHMSDAFRLLRANDLIWSFYIDRYLLDRQPQPFDLLHWNADSTRMPRRMHSFYLRTMYLHNRLPTGIELADVAIDPRQIEIPLYFLATKDDHIAPWEGVFRSALLPAGPVRFVLGGSGHVAGVINPVAEGKYGYWTRARMVNDADRWFAGAVAHEGSWWLNWRRWIRRYSGPQVPAPIPGAGGLAALEEAPGSYVKVR